MKELDLETLMRDARATAPRPGSKERLRARILAVASGGALTLATSQASAAAVEGAGVAGAGKAGSLGLSILACFAAGGAVGAFVAIPAVMLSQPHPRAVSLAASAVPSERVTLAPSVRTVQTSPAPVTSVAPESSSPGHEPVARVERAADRAPSIQRETALLAQAQQALQRGEFTLALVWLDRHQREFPGGALAEEALCARVIAACSLGQRDGRLAASTFARRYPKSPLLPRVNGACNNLDPQ